MSDIVIAGSSFLVREGLKRIIGEKTVFKIKGEIKDQKELWVKLNSLKPDILIIDWDSFWQSDYSVISQIKEFLQNVRILILSNLKERQGIISLIQQGVLSFITKDCEGEEIITAISKAIKGEKYFCSEILDLIFIGKEEIRESEILLNLTEREIEIIKLIVKGYSNSDIAEQLFLSIHTVYTHKKNIMRKLRLKSPVELVLYAINSGLTEK